MEKQHKRKHPVSISIKGIYHPDGDDEPTEAELITDGYMYRLGKHWYVTYVETETTGYEGCITTLKVAVDDSDEAGNVVTLTRKGDASSHLIMQRGVRTLGSYNVFGNTMEIGVYTDDMEYEFGENGGRFHLHYTLDMNTNLLSENELTIEVTPA
ncbi:MAG TPA: DUF1934 domain-containing protein [Candidatus Faecivivens stercoripullorum]|uniref:DUF1934 domain-containing protein n=1 Tax=Candidatus Faecivivens stercoripullorum TaxID=2840805 RepID=A0A9D1H6J4_9FIRM|nr:DUF1934 domain-containing protein [Candidatus Faecivivens stercoripullorum]